MATGAPVIPGPPALKNDQATDFLAYIQWLQSFYKALTLEGGLGQLSGSFTIAGGANFADVAYATSIAPLIDNNYQVVASAVGSVGNPPDNAFIISGVALKTTSGCRIGTRNSPGGGNSVTFNYAVVRTF